MVKRVSRRDSGRETQLSHLAPQAGMNLSGGLHGEQPAFMSLQCLLIKKEVISPVDDQPQAIAFWKVRVSLEKSVRNQGQERSRHHKKMREII